MGEDAMQKWEDIQDWGDFHEFVSGCWDKYRIFSNDDNFHVAAKRTSRKPEILYQGRDLCEASAFILRDMFGSVIDLPERIMKKVDEKYLGEWVPKNEDFDS